MGKQVKISFTADTRKLARAFKRLDRVTGLRSLRRGIISTAKTIAAFGAAVGAVAAATGFKLNSMAADFEQSSGTIDDVFKKQAATMHSYAKSAAKDVGLAANEYNELASLIGTQLKQAMGGAAADLDKVGSKTNNLIHLGSDLSAMFGGTTKDAVEAISSALKGERDPIERYGVSLKQAGIDAKAAALGFTKVGGSFSNEAQSAATLALIMEQTADAHGKFARESDTFAHKQQVLTAKIKNLATALGMKLLPITTKIIGYLDDNFEPVVNKVTQLVATYVTPAFHRLVKLFKTDLLPGLKQLAIAAKDFLKGIAGTGRVDKFGNAITTAGRAGQILTRVIKALVTTFQAWWPFLKSILPALAGFAATIFVAVKAIALYTKVVQIAKAAQILFNVAMDANPIGLVIVAIGALVAGLIYLYQNNETFRKLITAGWQELTAVAVATWQTVGPIVMTALSFIQKVISNALTGISAVWKIVWPVIKVILVNAFSSMRGVVSTVITVITAIINNAVSVIKGVWGFWTGLAKIVTTAWNSIKHGISSGISNVISLVTSLPGRILSSLGNLGSLLLNVGKQVIRGFVDGITSGFSWVKDKLATLTNMLPDWKGPAPRDKRLLTPAGHLIMQSLVSGFDKGLPEVKRSLNSLTNDLSSWRGPELNARINAGLDGIHSQPQGANPLTTYNIKVTAWKADAQTGREIVQAIKEYEKVGGRR